MAKTSTAVSCRYAKQPPAPRAKVVADSAAEIVVAVEAAEAASVVEIVVAVAAEAVASVVATAAEIVVAAAVAAETASKLTGTTNRSRFTAQIDFRDPSRFGGVGFFCGRFERRAGAAVAPAIRGRLRSAFSVSGGHEKRESESLSLS